MSEALRARLRFAVTVALTLYGIYYITHPDHYGLIDYVDLPIHETGHMVFAAFGEFMHALGGTLLQLIAPAVFVIYFLRRHDRFAAGVAGWWLAQSFWNIAVYVKDARAQELPLVGGGEHDWAYLLDELGWLEQDHTVGQVVRAAGILIFLLSMVWCFANARTPTPEQTA